MTHLNNNKYVLIYQSATFNFFKALQYKSISMFKDDKTRQYALLDPFVSSTMLAEASEKTGFKRIRLNIFDDEFENITYRELRERAFSVLGATTISDVVLVNGHTNSKYERERTKFWSAYLDFKSSEDVPLVACMPAHLLFRQYALLYILMEYCAENNIIVRNIWEDPLQHKLDYIDNLQVKHYYFHKTNNSEDGIDTYMHNDVPFKFEFNPSQEHFYCIDTKRSINPFESTKGSNKVHNFMFAMTDSWPDRDDRRKIISLLEYMILDPVMLSKKRLMFRYYSVNKKLENSTKLIPYEQYLKLIAMSKFTLTIPSYDSNCFSLRRFFEAVTQGCIPLILDTCNYKAGFSFNEEFIDFIEEHLLVRHEDLPNLHEIIMSKVDTHEQLLKSLLSTKLMQIYHHPKFYSMHIDKLFS